MESTRDRFEDRGRLAVGSGSEGVPNETVAAALQRLRSLEEAPARAGVFAHAPEETTDGEEAVAPVAKARASSVFCLRTSRPRSFAQQRGVASGCS